MNCLPHGVCPNQSVVDIPALCAADRKRTNVTLLDLIDCMEEWPLAKSMLAWSDPSPSSVMRWQTTETCTPKHTEDGQSPDAQT